MPENNDVPATPESTAKIRSEKSSPSAFWILAGLILPVMNLAARYEILDAHKFPRSGAFVFSPNHYSEIDPVVMGVVAWKLGRLPRFLAKESVFKIPVIGWVLTKSGQIPVQRGGSVRGSEPVKAAQRLADKGQIVVVYPEGSLTRDPDLWPMRGKTGAVRIALEQGIPIVPAAHWGTQHLMERYSKKVHLFPRKTITVKIGDPIDLAQFRGRSLDTATLNEATAVVMLAITALLEDLRGEKAPVKRWNPAEHNQKETGRFEA
ncbi:1-acyl-sn-glycerol-3-phosphate acyltransferase [Cryobacterium levicorallinum]|uniref:1-acyl-sn-glycerol-3-phosphate acyltransferases n=2 Tax=Cryobacterium levicorallinum TaxID=995038 RepID=A0ABY1ED17_9MICO|nr:lysophospholipid acyltransferase family protein [Cryobacterium levicorallinum]GEP26643.1 1-acyl-sn-glycerol-3-phosphate acyltransferase [Cryobacterium levicorallinum]SFH48169.1 1-acyl-sn-glycerol-3-phosphate acyltransferases [Cryobacterium levicorallinum]